MTHKIFEMPVADVYVHYVNKIERKERTEAELVKVITWSLWLISIGVMLLANLI